MECKSNGVQKLCFCIFSQNPDFRTPSPSGGKSGWGVKKSNVPPLENWSLPTLDTGGGISLFQSDRGNDFAKGDRRRSPLLKSWSLPTLDTVGYQEAALYPRSHAENGNKKNSITIDMRTLRYKTRESSTIK